MVQSQQSADASALVAEIVCHWCLCIFREPLGRNWNGNHFCSDECRVSSRQARHRKYETIRSLNPGRILANRNRNRAWSEQNRACVAVNQWLKGAPPFAENLPCVEMDVAFSPMPKWPVSLRSMRGIHGAVTALLGETVGIRHEHRMPTFAARIHEANRLRVLVWGDRARSLYGATYNGTLWGRPTSFTVDDLVDVAAPPVSHRRGRIPVRLTAITPVCISKEGHTKSEVRPCSTSIEGSLGGSFLGRFGMEYLAGMVKATPRQIRTEPSHTYLGGKYRVVSGWTGEVELEVNAPALWLLLAAEKVGFGSRTAFGFGRIVVEEL